MPNVPWSEITSLGVGGTVAVLILWMVFKFLDKRASGQDKIVLILQNQTKILEHLVDHVEETKDNVLIIKTRQDIAAH